MRWRDRRRSANVEDRRGRRRPMPALGRRGPSLLPLVMRLARSRGGWVILLGGAALLHLSGADLGTLLGLAGGVSHPAHRGYDLGPLLRGEPMARPPVFFEKLRASDELRYPPGPALSGMVDWPWKVVWMEEFNRFRIYNLAADPGEDTNVHRTMDAATRHRLRELVRTWRSHVVETYEPRH